MPKASAASSVLRRIAACSARELAARGWQEICKQVDSARWHLRQGPPPIILSKTTQHSRFFFSKQDLGARIALLRERVPDTLMEILSRGDRICHHEFDLLGFSGLRYGHSIDWQLDIVNRKRAPQKLWHRIRYLNFDEVGDSKIIWELNRHQHLITLAKAYLLTGNSQYAQELYDEWYHWWKENPYPIGINWASSLEVGVRALSWLWIENLVGHCPVTPKCFSGDLLHALGISGRHMERYLSTYFSPNTHLLGEGVALFFIGTLCPQLAAAKRWQKLGWEIILGESEHQVQPDGMHFEQSIYYHV